MLPPGFRPPLALAFVTMSLLDELAVCLHAPLYMYAIMRVSVMHHTLHHTLQMAHGSYRCQAQAATAVSR